jgi:hypothetical protein
MTNMEPQEMTAELMPRNDAQIPTPETVFSAIMERAKQAVEESKCINVTDPTDLRGMKSAREARLAIRAIRIEADKAHKELKADILRAGRAIDGMKNIVLQATEPEEKRLEDCEKYAERIQAQRDAELQTARMQELADLGEIPEHHGVLHVLSADMWEHKINGIKAMVQARKDAEEKARIEAEAKAKAEREEQERIRAENERLRQEAAEKERQLKAEREAAEKARKEAEAVAKAEADKLREQARKAEQARVEAERKIAEEKAAEEAKRKQEEAAKARAEKAPDADKLSAYMAAFDALPLPEMKTKDGKAALADIATLREKYAAYIAGKITALKG